MFANIPLVIDLSEAGQLSWDTIKLIIQSQHNLAMVGITVILGMAFLLAAGSWFANFYLVRRELKDTIKTMESKITAKEEEFKGLAKKIEEENNERITKIENRIEEVWMDLNTEKSRLLAISSGQDRIWDLSSYWWSEAARGYAEMQKPVSRRNSIDCLISALGFCTAMKDEDKERIRKNLSSIPKLLYLEKEKIEKRLSELPKKEPEP